MPPSELPRPSRVAGRHRPLGAFIILLVLCLISFALGVFVGKQHQETIPQAVSQPPQTHPVVPNVVVTSKQPTAVSATVTTQPVMASSAVDSGNSDVTQSVSSTEENDSDVGRSAGAAAPVESMPAVVLREQSPLGNGMNQIEKTAVVVPTSKPVVSASTVPVVEPTVVKPAMKPVTNSVKVPAQSATTAGYVVQVGSFKKESDAQKVKDRLHKAFPVLVKRADLGAKGVWYRVLVGPVVSPTEAGKIREELHKTFKLSGFVKRNSN